MAVLVAEIDWIQFIVYCGGTAALIAVGVYLTLAVRERMADPQDYESVGDDLESLRQALKLGSIDEAEYRRAVQALQMMNQKLNAKPVEPLLPELLMAVPKPSVSGPVFQEIPRPQAEQDTQKLQAGGEQATELELPKPEGN